ncbi:hypothetical protein ACIPW9_32575 [Streptomyces sp. NPDC090052]|uniref:hypothetical protein n=1 Tax=unclassified Streptomyces TaxID=2593676 RepID=UPI002252502B|nr:MULTISPECIES: hypothetical protein [unclassified Streptomyces]MCX4722804.1 hypothetical protein [Streptomyces sp. NBC_01306]WSV07534.1 hypothetical protein OG372_30475 [Streptomyces sp. NBC_01020]WSX66299.1 hypothetical protein OG221_06510 [Streptomyces sp. NBC_00932]
MTNSENGADRGRTDMTLRLRGKLQWVPVAAVVVLVAWVVAIPPVVSGAYGAVGGTLMVIAGLLLAFFTATFVGYLVRPLRLAPGADGLTVHLPLWPARTVPWSAVAGVAAADVTEGGRTSAHVVVDFSPEAEALPRFCRPRSMYRRLAPSLGRSEQAQGLCIEAQVFDVDPAGLVALIREYAPGGIPVSDPPGARYGEPGSGSAPHG